MEMMDSDESETDKINVVPLADLSLVLLIIMMLMAPAALSSMIRVETPRVDKVKSKNRPSTKSPDPLFIKVTKDGITLNNTPMESVEFMGEQIAIKLHDEPDRSVILAADDVIQVGDVVHILDVAKQNGADKISLLKGAHS